MSGRPLREEETAAPGVLQYRGPGARKPRSFNRYDVLTSLSIVAFLAALILWNHAASKLSLGEKSVKDNWLRVMPLGLMLSLLSVGAVTALVGAVLGGRLRGLALTAAVVHLAWLGLFLMWLSRP